MSSTLPYPHPKIPAKRRFPQWCEIGTDQYTIAPDEPVEFLPDGSLKPKRYYPFRDENGKCKRIRCKEVIIFQAAGNLNSFDPSSDENLRRVVRVYIDLPPPEERLQFYSQMAWNILVFPEEKSTEGRAYISTRASVYENVNPHVEFVCALQD